MPPPTIFANVTMGEIRQLRDKAEGTSLRQSGCCRIKASMLKASTTSGVAVNLPIT